MATALFVYLHNAGRSQMSAALFDRAAEGRHQALSAATTPADRVHPEVIDVICASSTSISPTDGRSCSPGNWPSGAMWS
jgi:protein-tyrosine-phosphatase